MNRIAFHITQNGYEGLNTGEQTFKIKNDQQIIFGFESISKDFCLINNFLKNEIGLEDKDFLFFSYCLVSNTLTAVVDYFASMPLYYFEAESEFKIDSDFAALVNSTPNLSLNSNYLQAYFDMESSVSIGDEETIFLEIKKVLPANKITWQNGKLNKHCYWKVNLDPEIQNLTEAQIYDDFKAKLESSILSRTLQNKDKIGSELSGGLDSSSLVALLAKKTLGLPTFFYQSKTENTDEAHFAQSVVEHFKTEHESIEIDYDNVYDELVELTKITLQPDSFYLPATMLLKISKSISNKSINLLISGRGGDSIVSYGFEYLEILYQNEDMDNLRQDLDNLAFERQKRNYEPSYSKDIKKNAYYDFFIPKLKSYIIKKDLKSIWRIFLTMHHFNLNILDLWKIFVTNITIKKNRIDHYKSLLLFTKRNPTIKAQELNPELTTKDLNIVNHFNSNYFSINFKGNEVFSALGNRHNFRVICPFLDKELLEYSLMVPAKIKFASGKLRGTLRNAMLNELPLAIQNRTSKAGSNEVAYHLLMGLLDKFDEKTYKKTWEIVDKSKYDNLKKIVKNKAIPFDKKRLQIWQTTKIISFAIWLDLVKSKLV